MLLFAIEREGDFYEEKNAFCIQSKSGKGTD